jgi:hypothetical protein
VDKQQQQDAWELLRANARHHSATVEQGDGVLAAVEEITRQSLHACKWPHTYTITN